MANIDVFAVTPKQGDIPFNPYLHIYLSEHACDSAGFILLSSRLMTNREIDEAVDLLVKQLEEIRKTAKIKLKKARERSN